VCSSDLRHRQGRNSFCVALTRAGSLSVFANSLACCEEARSVLAEMINTFICLLLSIEHIERGPMKPEKGYKHGDVHRRSTNEVKDWPGSPEENEANQGNHRENDCQQPPPICWYENAVETHGGGDETHGDEYPDDPAGESQCRFWDF
jgi:hypothetical protein